MNKLNVSLIFNRSTQSDGSILAFSHIDVIIRCLYFSAFSTALSHPFCPLLLVSFILANGLLLLLCHVNFIALFVPSACFEIFSYPFLVPFLFL